MTDYHSPVILGRSTYEVKYTDCRTLEGVGIGRAVGDAFPALSPGDVYIITSGERDRRVRLRVRFGRDRASRIPDTFRIMVLFRKHTHVRTRGRACALNGHRCVITAITIITIIIVIIIITRIIFFFGKTTTGALHAACLQCFPFRYPPPDKATANFRGGPAHRVTYCPKVGHSRPVSYSVLGMVSGVNCHPSVAT